MNFRAIFYECLYVCEYVFVCMNLYVCVYMCIYVYVSTSLYECIRTDLISPKLIIHKFVFDD